MKKQLTYLLAAVSLFCLNISRSHAQIGFSGGILAGVSMGAVEIDELGQGFTEAANGNNIYGFEGGLYAKLLINPFYIKPSVLYDYRQGEVSYADNAGSYSSDFSVHKIQVPLMLGFHILGPLNVEAGPVYNYLLGVTENYNSTDVDLGKNGLGYRIGATAELGPLTLGLAYQGAYYSAGSGSASFSEPYKIIAGIGIRLGGTSSGDDKKE